MQAHTAASKTELTAHEKFAEPRNVEVLSITPNRKELGKLFKKEAKAVGDALEALAEGGWWPCTVGWQQTVDSRGPRLRHTCRRAWAGERGARQCSRAL